MHNDWKKFMVVTGVSLDNHMASLQTFSIFDNSHRSYSDLAIEDLEFMNLPEDIINLIYYNYIWDKFVHPW